MDRKIILSVLLAALLAFLGLWLLLNALPDERAGQRLYPWDTHLDPDGRLRVFGLGIGVSTLADVRALVGEEGKLTLFAEPDGGFTVEAYFNDVLLANLRADWVVPLAVPAGQLTGMYERGLRVSRLASGSRKVTLDPADLATLAAVPVAGLTYLPWQRLSEADLLGRFGTPDERLTASDGVAHWLYPARGFDIARDGRGAVVIQYVNPADFARLRAPLTPPP